MANPFDAVIQVLDKASGPLRTITNAFTGMGSAAGHAGKEIKKADTPRGFAALTGHVTLLRGHFGRLQESIGEAGHSLTEFLPMLGSLGGAGSLVGLFEMTEHASEAWGQLSATATKIGVSANQLQAFDMAAKLTDVSVESMDDGLQKLNRTVGMAAGGQNKQALLLFQHLGISVRDSSGHLRSAADMMPQLADAFANTTDPAMRARMATALFGKAGQDLLPVLLQGGAGMEKFAAISKQVNYAPSEDEAKGMEDFHRGWIELEAAVGGVTMAIGAKLAPVLAPLLTQFTTWIAANRDWIATGIAAKVGELGTFLKSIDVKGIVTGFEHFGHIVGEVTGFLGPANTAIGAVALLIGAPFIAALGAAAAGISALGGAFVSAGALMMANPIGLVIVAVVALGVAAYEVWKHWDWVKGKFLALWTWFKGQTATIKAIAKAIGGPFIGIPLLIMDNWTPIKDFFLKLWKDVKDIFGSAMKAIGPIIDKINAAAGWVSGKVGAAGAAVSGAFGGAVSGAERMLHIGGGQAEPATADTTASPLVASSPAVQMAGVLGTLQILVNFSNTPPGTRVSTQRSGAAPAPEVGVGYSYPAFGG